MIILFDVFLIIFLFFLFGFSHSFLASIKIKRRIAEKVGLYIAFYRPLYNLFSLILLYSIYRIAPKPDIILYDLDFPYDIIVYGMQVLSLIGIVWAALSIDWGEFIGISQIERWYRSEYLIDELDERINLNTEGLQKISRHPIYFFTILFLGFRPTMSLFYFVFFICIIIYFYIGSYYEEKKLLKKFGDRYSVYVKNTPRIFPLPFSVFMK